ncbi:hypothetical protein OG455_37330 [Kitasatospora sp. NBC_01287]|uniref:hypothetical protein n=1 Tax=Kitasatospora sp. NBC_01287 TaxID=2903573 RepID=UPI002255B4D5|nr:hypothetical protein [Kitasatospora sp. NBC_01287]MCX4751104.1 hypothetical protein [Kitasatospora sp. NBC_01287]
MSALASRVASYPSGSSWADADADADADAGADAGADAVAAGEAGAGADCEADGGADGGADAGADAVAVVAARGVAGTPAVVPGSDVAVALLEAQPAVSATADSAAARPKGMRRMGLSSR